MPFLSAAHQVLQDAPAFRSAPEALDSHFKSTLKKEVQKQESTTQRQNIESQILPFPAKSSFLSKQAPLSDSINNAAAIPIRELQICALRPDELFQGWLGRMHAVNCLLEKQDITQRIAKTAHSKQSLHILNPDITHHASTVLGVARNDILERHTLTPFLDALEGLKLNKPGTKSSRHKQAYDRRAPLRLEGKHPRFCEHCVQEEMEQKEIPCWHREHQLPGVLWCSKHGTPLRLAKNRTAFRISPYFITDYFVDERLAALTSEQIAILQKYAHIATEILRQGPQIDSLAASAILGEWAREKDLRITKVGKRKTVSTHIINLMPEWWLADTFPRVCWSSDHYISTIDGACSPRTTRYTTATLCILAAVLCEDVNEALQVLWAKKQKEVRWLGADFWASKSTFALYVREQGNATRVANELSLPSSSVALGLQKQGLPGLGHTSPVKIKAIQEFLNGEESIKDISAKHCIPESEIEDILRIGCSRLKTALDAISKQSTTSNNIHSLPLQKNKGEVALRTLDG